MKNNRPPKISVIIPSYNQGVFLREAISSVLDQQYPNIEIFVADGGSSDESVEVLRSYGSAIRWVSEKDNGQTDAILKGLRETTGEIVCYVNSDDYLEKGALERVGAVFSSNPSCMWMTGDYRIVNEKGVEIQSYVRKIKTFFRSRLSFPLLSIMNPIAQPSTFFRRSALEEVNSFDSSLRYCMDYDLWMRLIQRSKPVVVSHILSNFRIHSLSKGTTQFVKQFAEEHEVMKRYTNNILLRSVHALAVRIIVLIYTKTKTA
ncbi:MAG: Glycosyl transferase family 2 [Microgenomates group bacterium GW2011_GWF2_45_18]|nr:MAG: Glycosyl transferase family 2 [Microgenomates group bacterium GW2011_GWF1_44_10]KKU02305.1 MAG: Glycosyl transferase family 2 [Microgenomates group bacterium GW2011_GWF2_45_18]OGJ41641.1 MAG: hypothetical protein A2378_02025 [Candidatus Pacebacteria bacterium RIFOXYB1_FULL_44_10]HAU99229.1 glycosyltransferase [Candidatus Paceibacterota bacterium]HAX01760.1 glycosyltransferase [Candidatus Paceibacterota bacterium]